MMAAKGRVTKIPVKGIHTAGRAATGYKSRQDTKEPYVEPAEHGDPALLTVLASGQPLEHRQAEPATKAKSQKSRRKTGKSKKRPAKPKSK
jgi:hypothetical protein